MKRTLEKVIWAFAGSAMTLGVALTYGVAVGQQGPPGPGGPGGPGGGPVFGAIVQVKPEIRAVQVGQRWVQIPQGVMITKRETIAPDDIKVGDPISVTGVPTDMLASSIEITTAAPAQAQGGAGAPGGPGGGRPQVWASVSGTVAGVNPLVVTGPDNAKVTVITNEQTKLGRRKQVGVEEIAAGEQFAAFGAPDGNGVVQARGAAAAATPEELQSLVRDMMRSMFGDRGRFGGRRGGGGFGGPAGPPPAGQ